MIEIELKISVQAKCLTPMIQALATIMFQASLDNGCVDSQLFAETGNPRALRYVEQWASREVFEAQINSQRFSMLLALMETASEMPNLEIRTITERQSLDYINTIRMRGSQLSS